MKYACRDDRRLEVVKALGTLNGIEYLEVSDHDAPVDELRQRTLFLRLIRPAPALMAENVRIDGGDRIPVVGVEWVRRATDLPAGELPTLVADLDARDHVLVVRTEQFGDFSQYRLRLVTGPQDDTPPMAFDPRLAEVRFSFKVECPTELDCIDEVAAGVAAVPAPDIDYLARDYASFRRLMLDRMSLVAPDWRERNPGDLGVALVELLAYVADQLAYRQDAIATEAYLGTARRRVSLRRHARLVDYRVHEGCNARAWVRFHTEHDAVPLPHGTQLLTSTAGLPRRVDALDETTAAEALARGARVFETVGDWTLYGDHDRFEFYTWGDEACWLQRGACAATLRGDFPRLKAGDVLVIAEEVGPLTGVREDADRTRRWPVRLTRVRASSDPSGGLFLDPPTAGAIAVTEIEWARADALPSDFCLSTRTSPEVGGEHLPAVTVALGNVVLADHGRTLPDAEDIGTVQPSELHFAPGPANRECDGADREVPPRFRPVLGKRGLTFAHEYGAPPRFDTDASPALVAELGARTFGPGLDGWLRASGVVMSGAAIRGGDGHWSITDRDDGLLVRLTAGRLVASDLPAAAATAGKGDPRAARPAITLEGVHETAATAWTPRSDLLASEGDAPEFVVEIEHDGTAELRFGDDTYGRRPNVGTAFTARYRVGNGRAGNVGAESITHVVSSDGRVIGVTNPLPASGGVDAESAEAIRRDAPQAFRRQERAVTPADYAEVAERYPGVQRATSTFRWTGSWHTVFLTVDREDGAAVDEAYESELRGYVERYRMAGYDLEVDGPRFVSLEIALDVCVRPEYFRAHVQRELSRVLGRGWRENGERALFHPDGFTFGQPVYLSDLYAAVQSVPGVESAVVTTFQRLLEPDPKPLADGVLPIGRLEVARLDNDPNFPERGVLSITLGGGR